MNTYEAPTFWEAIWALASAPLVVTIVVILIGALITTGWIDRHNDRL